MHRLVINQLSVDFAAKRPKNVRNCEFYFDNPKKSIIFALTTDLIFPHFISLPRIRCSVPRNSAIIGVRIGSLYPLGLAVEGLTYPRGKVARFFFLYSSKSYILTH